MKEFYSEANLLSIPKNIEEMPLGGYEFDNVGAHVLTGDYKRDITMLVRVINSLLHKVGDLEYYVEKLRD